MEQFGAGTKGVAEYQRILDDKNIDAVVVGTPDHWHTPVTIDAVKAGKDVYCEKPVTHELSEGDALIEAVESSRQVVATGTQQRSWKHFREAKRIVDDGVLGKITLARCYWYQNYTKNKARLSEPFDETQLDWQRWLGSARDQPFDKTRYRFWRFFWDFGGGSFTDLMTHWIDVIQWFMGSSKPSLVSATGTTYTQDWLEAPDTVSASMQFPEGYTALYDGMLTCGLEGGGIVFRGDKAMMKLTRLGYDVYPEGVKAFEATSLPEPIEHFARSEEGTNRERVDGNGTLDNVRNWVDCMRSRKQPNSHIRAGVEAAATSHWANVAMREQRVIRL
jgi:predicted dehydrogenase